ncbi:MAG: SMP-30/gluconolactonase/LRE family protein [Bryobacterales bacterium]|nr:SMP-30/gluconolactonase/LRE family protein [Bryobacterales bacterium]
MNKRTTIVALSAVAALAWGATVRVPEIPSGRPSATIDLATGKGTKLVKGQWRYSDASIVAAEFLQAGDDGQPSRVANRTYDIAPQAGGGGFDDSAWAAIEPETLQQRRGNGRLSFNWYRIRFTVPASIDGYDPTGSTVVFETSVDDYAEVWVDGELPRAAGQSGGSVISGWNAPNRLVVGRNVKPGQQIQLAIFGSNGPLSNAPTNYIWMRYARLEFFAGTGGPVAISPREVNVRVERRDDAVNELVPLNPKLYKLAEGFQFTEGPVWVRDEGYLLFSDPNANTIYRYTGAGELSVLRHPSGYAGADAGEYGQPGSNGLTLDRQGRVTVCEHGNHRVSRIERDGSVTVLADSFEGKRLNSPNDLVYRSDGALFFTDPPFGLPKSFQDPRKQLAFSGVFSLWNGALRLVSRALEGPNGIALSPDEKYLYVANWDDRKKVIRRYEVMPDATLRNGIPFFDMTGTKDENALDGLKVDRAGNLYASGPRGLWILSAEGKHLGTVIMPMHPHNFAWGDADGKSLYICARTGLYRMPLSVAGVRP